jgi:tetratricopeptide (TPR) repeat protein
MPNIDYEIEYLSAVLSSEQPDGWSAWYAAFRRAHDSWQVDRVGRLLQLIKRKPLSAQQQATVRYLEGRHLVRMGDWEAAQRTYTQALTMMRASDDRHGEFMVLNALGNLLRRSGEAPEALLHHFEHTLELATERGDERDQAAVLNGLGLVLYNSGQFTQARERLEHARNLGQKLGFLTLEATALHNLGSVAWSQGALNEAEQHFTAALALQRQLGDQHGLAETLNSLGLVQEARSDWRAAADNYTQSLALMQTDGDFYGQAQALLNLGNVCWLLGDAPTSLLHHQQVQTLATGIGDRRLEGQAWSGIGDSLRQMGRYAEAEEAFQRAIALKKAVGERRSLKHTYLSLGVLYHVQRRADAAQTAYEQALEEARAQQDSRMEAAVLTALAQLAIAQARYADALDSLTEAEAIAQREEYWDRLTEIARLQGDLELLQPEPNPQHILSAFSIACVYATRVNQATLDELLDYLATLWTAQAEDGYPNTACWFCEAFIAVWQHAGYADTHPDVIAWFEQLQEQLQCPTPSTNPIA